MAKLKGKKKAAFLRRMAAGRRKAVGIGRKVRRKTRKIVKKRRKSQSIRRRRKSNKTVARKRRSIRSRATGGFRKITGNKFVRGAVFRCWWI